MKIGRVLTAVMLLALGACANKPPVTTPCAPCTATTDASAATVEAEAVPAPAPGGNAPQGPGELEMLVSYLGTAKTRQPSELQRDLETAKGEFTATGSEASRVKLAYLYLQPGTPFRNEALALKLLQPYVRGDVAPSSPYRGIAQLLLDGLSEVRRAEAALQAQVAKAKEEQRRADELERKLDALKNVERAMILKDQKSGTK
jgi:hypothetical protein